MNILIFYEFNSDFILWLAGTHDILYCELFTNHQPPYKYGFHDGRTFSGTWKIKVWKGEATDLEADWLNLLSAKFTVGQSDSFCTSGDSWQQPEASDRCRGTTLECHRPVASGDTSHKQ